MIFSAFIGGDIMVVNPVVMPCQNRRGDDRRQHHAEMQGAAFQRVCRVIDTAGFQRSFLNLGGARFADFLLGLQSGADILGLGQLIGQNPCVLYRHTRALGDERQHRVGAVAE